MSNDSSSNSSWYFGNVTTGYIHNYLNACLDALRTDQETD